VIYLTLTYAGIALGFALTSAALLAYPAMSAESIAANLRLVLGFADGGRRVGEDHVGFERDQWTC